MSAYFRWKYTVLLAAMITLLFSRATSLDEVLGGLLIDICAVLLFAAALMTITKHHRFRRIALAFGIPAVACTLASRFLSAPLDRQALVGGRAFSAVFLGFAVVMILRELMTQRVVTWDSIVGTFCGYVMIGVMWSELYALLQLLSPDAIHFAMAPGAGGNSLQREWHHMQYFSFVTLSTVGYGDVTPVTPIARALAMLEAVCGQFYLAVLVAALVGLRVSHRVAAERPEDSSGGANPL